MRRWALHCSWPSAVRLPMRKVEEAVSTEAAVVASTAGEEVASTVAAVEASAEAEVSEGDTLMVAAWVAAASHPAHSAADRVLAAAEHSEAAAYTEVRETLRAFPMVVAVFDLAADMDTLMATGGTAAAIGGGTDVIGVVTVMASAGPTTVTATTTTIITEVGTTAAGSIVERCARVARTGGGDTNSA